jgi:hypothetical protein
MGNKQLGSSAYELSTSKKAEQPGEVSFRDRGGDALAGTDAVDRASLHQPRKKGVYTPHPLFT